MVVIIFQAMATSSGQSGQPGQTSDRSNAPEEILFQGSPAAVASLGALLLTILTLGLYGLYAWVQAKGTSYRITSQRIVVEAGIFSKRMEQIDLYRVVDYVVERPFGQRIMGTGNIVLEAVDKTTPELRIHGIRTDVVALYERLRFHTEAERKRSGVRLMDMEGAPTK
jgi:uncharacterized membrane protein YdbT with pleckstrin-like domain